MTFAGSMGRILHHYGQRVTVYRDGEEVGSGRVIIQALPNRSWQYEPTPLGEREGGRYLCFGEASLPFGERGEWVVALEENRYDLRSARMVLVGEEPVYWRAILQKRGEEELWS